MIENVGLIVAQITNGILSEVRVVERKNLETRQAIQVQHLLETTNLIACNIQIG